MNLSCPAGRVLILPDPENQSSVLVIPKDYKRFSDRGTIKAVGPGRRHIDGKVYPIDFKVGDRVMFSRQGAFPFEVDGAKYFSLEAEGILATMLPDDNVN